MCKHTFPDTVKQNFFNYYIQGVWESKLKGCVCMHNIYYSHLNCNMNVKDLSNANTNLLDREGMKLNEISKYY